jgi:hypothetical protein
VYDLGVNEARKKGKFGSRLYLKNGIPDATGGKI